MGIEIFTEESGRKFVKLMAHKPTWPQKGEVEVEVTYYFDAYVRGGAPLITMEDPGDKYEQCLTMQFDDVSDSNRTVITAHPPAQWCLQPLFDAGIIKKVEGVTRPWGYLIEVDEKCKFVKKQEDAPVDEYEDEETVDEQEDAPVDEQEDEGSGEVFENKDGRNFCIRSLKKMMEAALAAHPKWRKARVIIYREASERDREARIVAKDGCALYMEECVHDPITVGGLMDFLNQENINLDEEVLYHFEEKSTIETAYAARFVTCYGMAPYAKGGYIKDAIEEDGVVLVISDWEFPEGWEEDEDDE